MGVVRDTQPTQRAVTGIGYGAWFHARERWRESGGPEEATAMTHTAFRPSVAHMQFNR